ncbi:hypothetical protein, partial [Rhizobium leguminosarum]|uniref:hypothetical protein n=1 Tax=Rhizobium leguminosarum TaxID=384 RepID=UPI003F944F53
LPAVLTAKDLQTPYFHIEPLPSANAGKRQAGRHILALDMGVCTQPRPSCRNGHDIRRFECRNIVQGHHELDASALAGAF